MVSFYNETESEKVCFITVISIDKWYKYSSSKKHGILSTW